MEPQIDADERRGLNTFLSALMLRSSAVSPHSFRDNVSGYYHSSMT